MKNWFIYPFFEWIINSFKYLNLVEFFKFIANFFSKNKEIAKFNSRIAVDIFITLKISFVLFIFIFDITNTFINILVWYLIISNLFTYFYYHIWKNQFVWNNVNPNFKRGFLNLWISILFSNLCFAYLYSIWYKESLTILVGTPKLWSLLYSMANSITVGDGLISSLSNLWYIIPIIQVIITFIFISIILGASIPNQKKV
jgi:hypothetical protein